MNDLLLAGLLETLQPLNFLLLAIGSFLGLLVGVLPGLSSPMAIAVLIPLTYGMNPIPALMILIGIYIGTKTGGAYSAILVRTPGTPAAAATAVEGHPMALKGDAGQALGISVIASTYGGLISWVIAVVFAGTIGRYAVRISAADLAMIGIFALTMVAALSGRDTLKGLMAASIGLIVSSVGLDELTGVARLTFGHFQLMGGLPFLAAIIGLFAVGTVLYDVAGATKAAGAQAQLNFSLPSLRLLREIRWSMDVGTAFGTVLGIIPGVGADTAGWLSYAHIKRRLKNRKFGEGVPEGVAAPEAANNAVTGGAVLPMLTLGIPGDASTAVMLGALMLYGLQPGPLFFTESPEVAYGFLAALGVANITTLIIALVMVRPFVAILRLNRSVLYGSVLVLALVGGFAGTNATFDMAVVIGFGIVGFLMEKYGFSIPAMALGIILGPLIESNFRRALMISRGDATVFLTSPISLACIVILGLIFVRFLVRQGRARRRAGALGDSLPSGHEQQRPH